MWTVYLIRTQQKLNAEQKTLHCIDTMGAKMQKAGVDYFLGKNINYWSCMDRFSGVIFEKMGRHTKFSKEIKGKLLRGKYRQTN